jgi:sugar phosphate isomerase/epimerase
MEICLITDEISADPETAIELGVEWGITNFELRGFFSERVPLLKQYQKDKLMEILNRYQARIVAISPGLFKFPLPDQHWKPFPISAIEANQYHNWKFAYDLAQDHLNELLPASIDYAKNLGAHVILAFSFQRGGITQEYIPDIVVEFLQKAALQTTSAGLSLAIEVEAGFWADTGEHTRRLLDEIGISALGINWDPGNAFEAGEIPYPDGYSHIQNKIHHVHFKDIHRLPSGIFEYALVGDINWPEQLNALNRNGYKGFISIETHLWPKVSMARQSLNRLKKLLVDNQQNLEEVIDHPDRSVTI